MRRAALLLVICVAGLAAVLWVALLPGAARFEAGDLSIDAATPTLVFSALAAALILYGLVRGIAGLIRLPRRLRHGRAARRRRDGDRAITRALVALAAAQHSDALAETARARRLLGDTPQTLLLAADANRLAGRDATAGALYTTLAELPEATLLGLRGLLEQAMIRRDWPAARALADRAERAHPSSAWLRDIRLTLAGQGSGAGGDVPRIAGR